MSLPDLDDRIRWIKDDAALASTCVDWLKAAVLVIDTEFVRRRTYYPIPALLQFYDGEQITIVDPINISQWQPLAEVLSAPGVLKIFHAASEDLEVFWRLLGTVPKPLFDTQVAAGLCGLRPSMGYNKLVMALCNVDLPKDETQSDWLVRPLSENQINYAAYDVYYLYLAFEHLYATAADIHRLEWVLQDSARLGVALSTLIEPDQAYLKLKGVNKLSSRELAIAQDISAWRERQAREQNLPRSWVLKDTTILGLARQQPQTLQGLSSVKDLQQSTMRKRGQRLLDMIEKALEAPSSNWPDPLPQPLRAEEKSCLEQVQATIGQCAEKLALAPELLLNRKQMSEVALRLREGAAQLTPPSVGGWRSEVLESQLKAIKCP